MLVAIVGVAPLVISLHAPAVQPRDEDSFLAASPRPYVHMRKQKDDYWDPVLAAEVDPVPADSWQPEAAASRHVMQPAPATVAAHAWQPEEAALNDNTGLSPTSVLTAVADAATADSSGADARAPPQQQLEKKNERGKFLRAYQGVVMLGAKVHVAEINAKEDVQDAECDDHP